MPRDLPLSNGSLLVNFDSAYNLRDIYFPHIGQKNQTDGHVNHVGVWVAGRIAWLDDAGWDRTLKYEEETLVTAVHMHHTDLEVSLDFTDTVDFTRPIFVREITITNHSSIARDIRLFFHYDWHIDMTDGANTIYYDPKYGGLIAYKDHRYFLMSGRVGDKSGISTWSIGYKEFNGLQGTWRDAEDGVLSGNMIAQGSVDCTLGLALGEVVADSATTVHHWLVAGTDIDEIDDNQVKLVEHGATSFITRTRDYWKLWVNKNQDTLRLPKSMIDLYKRSLLIIATQMDNDGAIIAATDGDIWETSRDSYGYMWPRDGALVANALSHSGYGESTRAFFNFCARVITNEGYLLHKYTPSGSLGSSWHPWANAKGERILPIQEDETALVIYSLWQHYALFRDVEFIKPLYAPLIKAAADFMVKFRHIATGLPSPSWDLWEERWGIHAYTVATTYAGLIAAANFARIFGEESIANIYTQAANEIQNAARIHLWDSQRNCFLRRVTVADNDTLEPDTTLDMAICALFQFGMIPANDPQMSATMNHLLTRLGSQEKVGGYARYENDYYHQVSHDVERIAGNPWFICSCWAAQYAIATATTPTELEAALPWLQWVVDHALASGVLAEQVDPYTGAPLSASPLTWSHAEFIASVRWYMGKYHRLTQPQKNVTSVGMGAIPGEPRLG